MTDQGLTADQCRIGRAAMGLSQEDLAAAADVGVQAVRTLEAGGAVPPEVAAHLRAGLASAGVTFYAGPDGSARMRAHTLDGIIETPVVLTRGR